MSAEARKMAQIADDYFYAIGEVESSETGNTPIPRRGFELMMKVALTVGIPGGVVEAEHIRWAYALIRRDMELKRNIAKANTAAEKSDQLLSKILSLLSHDDPVSEGIVINRCRMFKKTDVLRGLDWLIENEKISFNDHKPARGKPTRIFLLK